MNKSRSSLMSKRTATMAFVVVFAACGALPINAGNSARFQEHEKAPSGFQSILAKLIAAQGVTGYETDVRQVITSLLPQSSRSLAHVDQVGNLTLTFGSGEPSTLITAPMDEVGYVVSRIMENGYIRLNRVGRAAPSRLWDQYQEGQPVTIRTAGGLVQGVTACLSVHLQAGRADSTRATTLDDLWVDLGAASRAEVEKLGVKLLDPVTLRNRVTELADGQVAGVAAANRAGCAVLLMLADLLTHSPSSTGQVTLAWVAQESFGRKGSDRLSHEFQPKQVVRIDSIMPSFGASASSREKGLTGKLGAGPLIRQSSASLIALAKELHINHQVEPDPRSNRSSDTAGSPSDTGDRPAPSPSASSYTAGPDWKTATLETMALPAVFYGTPVETVSEVDANAMLSLLCGKVGIAPPSGTAAHRFRAYDQGLGPIVAERPSASPAAHSDKDDAPIPGYPTASILRRLIETYSVSGSEGRMREAVKAFLPGWAKPTVDGGGNLVVEVGSGKPYRVFLAHLDEIGYVIKQINEDGTLATEQRGGGLQKVYDAHPVLVHTEKGDIPGIQVPTKGYLDPPQNERSTAEAAPASDDAGGQPRRVVRGVVYLGTSTADATTKLEIKPGDSVTIPKRFEVLGDARATGRSMDDRMGCAALLAAVRNLDPASVRGRVSFVWTTGEEVGLDGARFFSEHMQQDPEYVFGIDTFVSSDSPRETGRFAYAPIGRGAVIRALDNSNVVPPEMVRQVLKMAADRKIALQYGVTGGGNDGSVFTRFGAYNIPLSWPLRYSHSPAEVVDLRDLESLAELIRAMIDFRP